MNIELWFMLVEQGGRPLCESWARYFARTYTGRDAQLRRFQDIRAVYAAKGLDSWEPPGRDDHGLYGVFGGLGIRIDH